MNSLNVLQEAIAGLNKQFGASPGSDLNPIRNEVFKQPKFVNKNKKWAKVRQAIDHNKAVSYQTIDCNAMRKALMDDLDYNRYDFVIPSFYYQGAEMDIFAMVHNRIIEFEIKTELYDFGNDFKKMYNLGRMKVNKHSYLEAGKGLPNFFYFVVPAGMLEREDVPGHCGLLAAAIVDKVIYSIDDQDRRIPTGQKKVIEFTMLKAAPLLTKHYFPQSIFKQIASKCYARYRQVLNKLILAQPSSSPQLNFDNAGTSSAGN